MDFTSPEIYRDVFDRLEHDRVRYVVTAGVAVVLHGHLRSIADLDIVIDPAPDQAERALRSLMCCGFAPSIPLPLSMLTVLRMFDATQREVDVFVRYPISFEEMWRDSELMRVGQSVARIASLEHVLRAKRFNGRAHDLLDITAFSALAGDQGKR